MQESKPVLHLVKIGGNLVNPGPAFEKTMDAFAGLPPPKVLVHGGGAQANELCQQLGVPKRMVSGRRITDAATLEIVTMVFAGSLNKRIVSHLQKRHCNALGLTGADGNTITAEKRPARVIDYGFVGDIAKVNGPFLSQLLDMDIVPTLCALTHDGHGQMLNTNADTIAARTAMALAGKYRVKLWFCMPLSGVLRNPDDPKTLIESINLATFTQYVEEKIIFEGMIPKLENAFNALADEVAEVAIGNLELLIKGKGTFIIEE